MLLQFFLPASKFKMPVGTGMPAGLRTPGLNSESLKISHSNCWYIDIMIGITLLENAKSGG